MPDLLSPRLLAQVERSLSKRISADVRRHLARCAVHARSEEDFVAAAARLLLNPREREQWLAAWQQRIKRPADPTDSSPAPLPATTRPAGLGAPVQRNFSIAPTQLAAIQAAFVKELGPAGIVLVESELKHSTSAADLLTRLQRHLSDDRQRERFVKSSLAQFGPRT